jgi:hypothetical protein
VIELTKVEITALRGMEALAREMHARHAEELHQHGVEWLEIMSDIAVAHGLPVDAFFAGWGITPDSTMIVTMNGITPAEVGT